MLKLGTLAISAFLAFVTPATAQSRGEVVTPTFEHVIPNIPGKSLIALEVTYSPGGASKSHRHPRSAFVFAYVLSGTIESQVEGEPARAYRAGESWYELPGGGPHLVSRNVSTTEPAKLLAVFVVDSSNREHLTTYDE